MNLLESLMGLSIAAGVAYSTIHSAAAVQTQFESYQQIQKQNWLDAKNSIYRKSEVKNAN
jgi:hypothetical protein